MNSQIRILIFSVTAAFGAFSITPNTGHGQPPASPDTSERAPVLVELFTSEGCSSCPPADDLLRRIDGRKTPQGQTVIAISEHVSYWDSLGWKDRFSSQVYTTRQSEYSQHFGLDSVYTPQMVVNGREQFVGGDGRSLLAAFASEAKRTHIDLHIQSAQLSSDHLDLRYSASRLPSGRNLQLFAVLVDDQDQSNVARGENSGRKLIHVSVARMFTRLGPIVSTEGRKISLPLPQSFVRNPGGPHHLIVIAQENGGGAVEGIDSRPI